MNKKILHLAIIGPTNPRGVHPRRRRRWREIFSATATGSTGIQHVVLGRMRWVLSGHSMQVQMKPRQGLCSSFDDSAAQATERGAPKSHMRDKQIPQQQGKPACTSCSALDAAIVGVHSKTGARKLRVQCLPHDRPSEEQVAVRCGGC